MKHDGRLKDFCVDAENNQQYIISVKRICYPQCTRGGHASPCTLRVVTSVTILRSEMVPDALLKRVPEMMDTPPILNSCAFIICYVRR